MGRQFINIEDFQIVCREQVRRRCQRKVRDVFVVNRIELVLFDEPHQMRKFQSDDAGGMEQQLQSRYESIQIGYVSKNVVTHNEVGTFSTSDQLKRKAFVEK